jgi:hypothetical protein
MNNNRETPQLLDQQLREGQSKLENLLAQAINAEDVPNLQLTSPVQPPATNTTAITANRLDYISPYADRLPTSRDLFNRKRVMDITPKMMRLVEQYRDWSGVNEKGEPTGPAAGYDLDWIQNFDKIGMSRVAISKETAQRRKYEHNRIKRLAKEIEAGFRNPKVASIHKDEIISKEKFLTLVENIPPDSGTTSEELLTLLLNEGFVVEGQNTMTGQETFRTALRSFPKSAYREATALFQPSTYKALGLLTAEVAPELLISPAYAMFSDARAIADLQTGKTPLLDSVYEMYASVYDVGSAAGRERFKNYLATEPGAVLADIGTLLSFSAAGTAKLATVLPKLNATKLVPILENVQKAANLLDASTITTYGMGKALRGIAEIPPVVAQFMSGKPRMMYREALFGPLEKGNKSGFRAVLNGTIAPRDIVDRVAVGLRNLRNSRNVDYQGWLEEVSQMQGDIDLTNLKEEVLPRLLKENLRGTDEPNFRVSTNPAMTWMFDNMKEGRLPSTDGADTARTISHSLREYWALPEPKPSFGEFLSEQAQTSELYTMWASADRPIPSNASSQQALKAYLDDAHDFAVEQGIGQRPTRASLEALRGPRYSAQMLKELQKRWDLLYASITDNEFMRTALVMFPPYEHPWHSRGPAGTLAEPGTAPARQFHQEVLRNIISETPLPPLYPEAVKTQLRTLEQVLAETNLNPTTKQPDYNKARQIMQEQLAMDKQNLDYKMQRDLAEMRQMFPGASGGLAPHLETALEHGDVQNILTQQVDLDDFINQLGDILEESGPEADALPVTMNNIQPGASLPIDFNGNLYEYGDYIGHVYDWSRTGINDLASRAAIDDIVRTIEGWGNRPDGRDLKPIKVDTLKQQIGKWWDPDKNASSFVSKMYQEVRKVLDETLPDHDILNVTIDGQVNTVKGIIKERTKNTITIEPHSAKPFLLTNSSGTTWVDANDMTFDLDQVNSIEPVKGYASHTKNYETISEMIKEFEKTMGASPNEKLSPATVDTQLKKLTTILKDNEEIRLDLVRNIENATEEDIVGMLAGYMAQDMMPARFALSATIGTQGLALVGGYGWRSEMIIPLLFMFPRATATWMNGLGIGAATIKKWRDAIASSKTGKAAAQMAKQKVLRTEQQRQNIEKSKASMRRGDKSAIQQLKLDMTLQ